MTRKQRNDCKFVKCVTKSGFRTSIGNTFYEPSDDSNNDEWDQLTKKRLMKLLNHTKYLPI